MEIIKAFAKISLLVILTATINGLLAQTTVDYNEGKVSFITSQNIYVKFTNTSAISIGDTLKTVQNGAESPCLIVTKKSSTSCVCIKIDDCVVAKEDVVRFSKKPSPEEVQQENIDINNEIEKEPIQVIPEELVEEKPEKKVVERIRGRLSAATYSSFPSERDASHRMLYRFSLNASHINNSKWSAESYVNFRQNYKSEQPTINTLRVYNLAARYDVDSTWNITLGRKINNKASSLGAIDGLQTEKHFGNFYTGGIVGFRPDIREFNFNPNLLEFGGYAGYTTSSKKMYSQSTLGLLEQRNLGQIDRRYTYFQHCSNIGRKLNLFASFEIDLYNKIQEVAHMDFRLTNFYASARYRFNRKINVTLSYDSRRRIIFYETLRTDVERLLADDEARQGLRFRLSVRPFKYINAGVAYSHRFQTGLQSKSDNINGYVSFNKLPVGGRMTLNYNHNTSAYLRSQIASFRYSRSMVKKKLNLDFYYRNVDYVYLSSENHINQHYVGTGLTYRLSRKWMFSVLGELSSKNSNESYRLNSKIIKRFGK